MLWSSGSFSHYTVRTVELNMYIKTMQHITSNDTFRNIYRWEMQQSDKRGRKICVLLKAKIKVAIRIFQSNC